MLIDPPTLFAPTAEWEQFLAEMRGVLLQYPGDEAVLRHIGLAEEVLAERTNA